MNFLLDDDAGGVDKMDFDDASSLRRSKREKTAMKKHCSVLIAIIAAITHAVFAARNRPMHRRGSDSLMCMKDTGSSRKGSPQIATIGISMSLLFSCGVYDAIGQDISYRLVSTAFTYLLLFDGHIHLS